LAQRHWRRTPRRQSVAWPGGCNRCRRVRLRVVSLKFLPVGARLLPSGIRRALSRSRAETSPPMVCRRGRAAVRRSSPSGLLPGRGSAGPRRRVSRSGASRRRSRRWRFDGRSYSAQPPVRSTSYGSRCRWSPLPDRRSGDRQADHRIDPPPAGPHGGDGQAHQHSGSLGGADDPTAPLRSARASRKRCQTIHAALVRPDQRDGHALLRSRRKLMSTHPAQARR